MKFFLSEYKEQFVIDLNANQLRSITKHWIFDNIYDLNVFLYTKYLYNETYNLRPVFFCPVNVFVYKLKTTFVFKKSPLMLYEFLNFT